MRIAHATDIHWTVPPRISELALKRIWGSANLYLRGRAHHFDRTVQQAVAQRILELAPDAVLVTGDLTSQALPAEFALAREDLTPVLERLPTFVIPGNHDAYTPGAVRNDLMGAVFGPWMGRNDTALARLDLEGLVILGLNPCRPRPFDASGEIPQAQLDALATALAAPGAHEVPIVLALHYPPIDRRGALYDGSHHGLRNAAGLIELLNEAPVRPALIACGHVHHGYQIDVPLSDGSRIPLCNCGTSGQAYDPKRRRAAAIGVYDIDPTGNVSFERYLFDGQGFEPEPGGAWATGR